MLGNKIENLLNKNSTDVKNFLNSATPEQLEFYDVAGKLLSNNNDMGIISDYTDDEHLNRITNACVEHKDSDFVKKLKDVQYSDDLMKLEDMVPDDETFNTYVSSLIGQLKSEEKQTDFRKFYDAVVSDSHAYGKTAEDCKAIINRGEALVDNKDNINTYCSDSEKNNLYNAFAKQIMNYVSTGNMTADAKNNMTASLAGSIKENGLSAGPVKKIMDYCRSKVNEPSIAATPQSETDKIVKDSADRVVNVMAEKPDMKRNIYKFKYNTLEAPEWLFLKCYQEMLDNKEAVTETKKMMLDSAAMEQYNLLEEQMPFAEDNKDELYEFYDAVHFMENDGVSLNNTISKMNEFNYAYDKYLNDGEYEARHKDDMPVLLKSEEDVIESKEAVKSEEFVKPEPISEDELFDDLNDDTDEFDNFESVKPLDYIIRDRIDKNMRITQSDIDKTRQLVLDRCNKIDEDYNRDIDVIEANKNVIFEVDDILRENNIEVATDFNRLDAYVKDKVNDVLKPYGLEDLSGDRLRVAFDDKVIQRKVQYESDVEDFYESVYELDRFDWSKVSADVTGRNSDMSKRRINIIDIATTNALGAGYATYSQHRFEDTMNSYKDQYVRPKYNSPLAGIDLTKSIASDGMSSETEIKAMKKSIEDNIHSDLVKSIEGVKETVREDDFKELIEPEATNGEEYGITKPALSTAERNAKMSRLENNVIRNADDILRQTKIDARRSLSGKSDGPNF
jgi:hypothetical protein